MPLNGGRFSHVSKQFKVDTRPTKASQEKYINFSRIKPFYFRNQKKKKLEAPAPKSLKSENMEKQGEKIAIHISQQTKNYKIKNYQIKKNK